MSVLLHFSAGDSWDLRTWVVGNGSSWWTFTVVWFCSTGPDWYLIRLEMTVMDVNDNVPEWTMVPAPYLAVVPPDAPAGTLVYRLQAQDGDEGNNGEVEYFLSDGGC